MLVKNIDSDWLCTLVLNIKCCNRKLSSCNVSVDILAFFYPTQILLDIYTTSYSTEDVNEITKAHFHSSSEQLSLCQTEVVCAPDTHPFQHLAFHKRRIQFPKRAIFSSGNTLTAMVMRRRRPRVC